MSKVDYTAYNIDELREFLIAEGYSEDDVQISKVKLSKLIQSNNLEDKLIENLDPIELNEEDIEMEDDSVVNRNVNVPKSNEPVKGSPEWNDYVLSKFTKDEYVDVKVDDGSKTIKGVKCDGLRRVAELVLGKIVRSVAVDTGVNYPDYSINKASDQVKLKNPPFAWVRYEVSFANQFGGVTTWGGCADVNSNNTDAMFLPFAFATAETRAEARALRKALGIKILAAEELTSIDTAATVESITNADWSDGPITDTQKVGIQRVCDKLKINAYRLINCTITKNGDRDVVGFNKDEPIRNSSLDDLSSGKAIKVMKMLNELQQKKKDIDPTLCEVS